MFLPLAEPWISEVGKLAAGGTDPSSVKTESTELSWGGGMVLVFNFGQMAPNQAPGQPKDNI